MKKQSFVLAAVIISSQLAAQDTTGRILDEVVISASKYPRKQSETGKVISVITKSQLEQSGAKSLGEILNTVAGITVTGANNNPGTNQTISIRGASAGNVLLLIDGIPVNDPSVITNYFDLNFISPDQAERIEILKGGQSTLYGSDAVAGVINIITRKAETGKTHVHGDISGGSYQTFRESFGFSSSRRAVDYSVQYTHINSNGFSAAHDSTGKGKFDDDKYNQHVLNGRLEFNITKKIKTVLSGLYSRYKTALDASAFTDDQDFTANNKNIQSGAGLVYTLDKGAVHLNYHFNRAEREYLDDSLSKGNPFSFYSKARYMGKTHYAEIYTNLKWKYLEWIAGADYRYNNTIQSFFSDGPFGPFSSPDLNAKMHQQSVYTSLIYKNQSGLNLELGGRWNEHSVYGSNFTFTCNPSYLLNLKLKLFANLYSAYKVPTLYQLFDPYAGNKDLEPEKALVSEAGLLFNPTSILSVKLTGFYSHSKQVILYTFNPSTFNSRYLNAADQRNYGAELELSYRKNNFSVTGNYVFTNGITTAGFDGTGTPAAKDTTYFNLYHIPKHAFNIYLGYSFTKSLTVNTSIRAVSKRDEYIYGSNPATLKGYATIDLYGEYRFDKIIKLFFDLRNITNRQYADNLGYNSRKFNFAAGARFQL